MSDNNSPTEQELIRLQAEVQAIREREREEREDGKVRSVRTA